MLNTSKLANQLSTPAQSGPAVARPVAASTAATQVAIAPQALPAMTPLLEQVRSQPRIAIILGVGLVAAALVSAVLWGRSPDYKILYANVSDHDGGAIVTSLQQMNVPYKFAEGGGAIMVPVDKASEVRLKLAAQGLPKSGGVGFELLDNQKFGTSQFAEQINYQRGLEGELARSIESIGSVQTARVHLALPKASLFVRDQKKPSASVLLTLHPGRNVDEGQVSAIVHMVSSSVPELDAKSVTLVDQRGNLLSSASASTRGLDVSQLKFVESIEQSYVRRIEAILQPLVGAGNVRAQVAADVDFTVVEHTDEKYRPNQEAGASTIRSQQTTESSQQGSGTVGGVPGALSNQAPVTPTAPLGAASPAAKAAAGAIPAARPSGNSRRDVTINYEVDHSIRHTQQGAGLTKRLSVAVVVNNREVRANGKTSMVPLTAAELEQVTNLVKEAMGFNQSRGDSVNVVNSAFTVDAPAAPEAEVPYWKDRANIELAKTGAQYLLAALAMLLVWLVIAKLIRHAPAQQAALPAGSSAELARVDAPALAGQSAQIGHSEESLALERISAQRKADVEFAQETATQDPRIVASQIRRWTAA